MTPLKKRMILRYRDFRMGSTINYKEEIDRPPTGKNSENKD
jgi:hypothetical protein